MIRIYFYYRNDQGKRRQVMRDTGKLGVYKFILKRLLDFPVSHLPRNIVMYNHIYHLEVMKAVLE